MRLQNLRKKMNSPQKCHQYSFNMKNVYLLKNKTLDEETIMFKKINDDYYKKESKETLKSQTIKSPFITNLKINKSHSIKICHKFDIYSNTSAENENKKIEEKIKKKKEKSEETTLKFKEKKNSNDNRKVEKRDIFSNIQKDNFRKKCKSVQSNPIQNKESFLECNTLEKEIFLDLKNKILKNSENQNEKFIINKNLKNSVEENKNVCKKNNENEDNKIFVKKESHFKNLKSDCININENYNKNEKKRGLKKKKPKLRKLVKKHHKVISSKRNFKIKYSEKKKQRQEENTLNYVKKVEKRKKTSPIKKSQKYIFQKKWSDLEKPIIIVKEENKIKEKKINLIIKNKAFRKNSQKAENNLKKKKKPVLKKEKIREIKSISKWNDLNDLNIFTPKKKKKLKKNKLRKGQIFNIPKKASKSPKSPKNLSPFSKKAFLKSQINSQIKKKMNEKITEIIKKLQKYAKTLETPREIITERINKIVKKTFQNEKIHVKKYGSYSTGLLTPYSDIDLSIQGCYYCDKSSVKQMLECLSDNLKLFDFIKDSHAILTAAVPVIKIIADSGISFENGEKTQASVLIRLDITVDLMEKVNIASTSIRTTDFIKGCVDHYPNFYNNVLLIKYALSSKEFNNSYTGGLNSYGLSLLYLAFIGFFKLEEEKDFFRVVVLFLEYYCTEFDWEKKAIDIGHGLCNFKNPFCEKKYFGSCSLVIMDPTSLLCSNVTPSCSIFETIRGFFGDCRDKISSFEKGILSHLDKQENLDLLNYKQSIEIFFKDKNPFYDFFSLQFFSCHTN